MNSYFTTLALKLGLMPRSFTKVKMGYKYILFTRGLHHPPSLDGESRKRYYIIFYQQNIIIVHTKGGIKEKKQYKIQQVIYTSHKDESKRFYKNVKINWH